MIHSWFSQKKHNYKLIKVIGFVLTAKTSVRTTQRGWLCNFKPFYGENQHQLKSYLLWRLIMTYFFLHIFFMTNSSLSTILQVFLHQETCWSTVINIHLSSFCLMDSNLLLVLLFLTRKWWKLSIWNKCFIFLTKYLIWMKINIWFFFDRILIGYRPTVWLGVWKL